MFDDDTSYMDDLKRTLRLYRIPVWEHSSHCFTALYRTASDETLCLVSKVKNLPFYKVFVAQMDLSDNTYTSIRNEDEFISFVFTNMETIKEFNTATTSGHDSFERDVKKIIKDTLK